MKKIFTVIVLTFAINFIAIAGGVGWMVAGKKLDREKVLAIKEIVFPKPVEAKPTSQPVEADPTTQPLMRLEDLLTKTSGRSATERVDFMRDAFQAQMLQMDRRELELKSLQRQIEAAKDQLAKDRAAYEAEKKGLDAREQQVTLQASDKGFQDSLALYTKMPPKQTKSIFMTLDDPTVMSYLQAMPQPTAAKIIKEFKSAEETARITKIMEQMRVAQAETKLPTQ